MAQEKAYWLMIRDFEIYMLDGKLPFGSAEEFGVAQRSVVPLGEYRNAPAFLVAADERDRDKNFVGLRSLLVGEADYLKLLHQAVSLHHFFASHRYCGKCGGAARLAEDEIALHCPACHQLYYPTISPSIIVAVRKGRQILLANHQRHKGTIYTVLAGFVEAGETVEAAVEREVWEETGIRIKNVRYVASQAWSFPHSLMLGFLADYASGEIRLQTSELADARWFDCDEPLPMLPPQGTIALALIQKSLATCRNSD